MDTITSCRVCGLAQRVGSLGIGSTAECMRCGAIIARPGSGSLERTAALSLAALLFYLPANLYPILELTNYGAYSESTIWDGCVNLFQDGQWAVAVIVFLASIMIPFLKLAGLFLLSVSAKYGLLDRRRELTLIHHFIAAPPRTAPTG